MNTKWAYSWGIMLYIQKVITLTWAIPSMTIFAHALLNFDPNLKEKRDSMAKNKI